MADQNITELPIKTNTGVANTDYMLGIDASEGYQILVRDVAKYIVENYNGSTLAGSAQTPKSAIDALNSKIVTTPMTASASLPTEEAINNYYDTYSSSFADRTHYTAVVNHGYSHSVLGGARCFLEGYKENASYEWQRITSYMNGRIKYYRNKYNGNWNSWIPDSTLGSGFAIASNSDLNDYTSAGTFYSSSSTVTNSLSHCPITGYGFRLIVEQVTGAGGVTLQKIETAQVPPRFFTRRAQISSGTWSFGDWIEQPSRAEVDALNSNLSGEDFTSKVTATEGEEWANTKFMKMGKACFVSYQGASKTHAANDVLCVLPTGYRPASQTYAPFNVNVGAYGNVGIMPNGNIYISAISSSSTTGRIYFNAVYFTA